MKTYHLSILPSTTPEWLELIKTRPEATFFHHPAWSKVIETCYGYRPSTLLLFDSDEVVLAGLPIIEVNHPFSKKHWIALPFTDYCNPLTRDPASLEPFTQSLLEMYATGCASKIEVRYQLPEITGLQYGYSFVTHKLTLNADLTYVMARLNKIHLQNIYRAEESGVRIAHVSSLEGIRVFYQLHLLTRKRQGVPIQPWRFFKLMVDLILNPGYGFILLAYLDRECIAGAMFFHWNQTLTYKYVATTSKGNQYHANNLILWEAIRWGCENGFMSLDLGKTHLKDEQFRRFLARWGAQESMLTYSVMSNAPPKTHDSTLKTIVQNIINLSPAWVCKTTGELFYKFSV